MTPAASTAAGPDAPLPGAHKALLLLLAINLFNFMDRQVLSAVEPEIAKEILVGVPRGDEEFWSGLLATAFLVSYMLIAPVFGVLADHMRRWALVAVGVILWSLASGASGLDWVGLLSVNLAAAYWLLLLTRCLVGVGEAAYGPVAPTMLADLYPVRHRGRVMSWFYLAIPVGGALGYTLGDLMLEKNGGLGWRWAFYAVVPPGLLLGLLCFLMREPPRGQAEAVKDVTPRKAGWRDYLDLLRIRSYVINMVGMTCLVFAIGAISYWMPRFLEARDATPFLGIPPRSFFGMLIALGGLVATVSGGMAGDWLRRYHGGSYFLVSGVVMILGFPMVLLALWAPFPQAWLFIFLAGFSLFFNTAPTNAINANVTHPSVRASAFAFNILVTHLFGDAISPPLIGWIIGHYGFEWGFGTVSTLMLVGGLFWIWGSFFLQRDTALAPTRLRGALEAARPQELSPTSGM
jgi:MFS family permease